MQLDKVKKKTTCPTIIFESPCSLWMDQSHITCDGKADSQRFLLSYRTWAAGPHWSLVTANTSQYEEGAT